MQSNSTFEGCADSIGYILRLGGFFMRIYHAKDYADMSRKAANIVSAQVIMGCISSSLSGSIKGIWTSQRL